MEINPLVRGWTEQETRCKRLWCEGDGTVWLESRNCSSSLSCSGSGLVEERVLEELLLPPAQGEVRLQGGRRG